MGSMGSNEVGMHGFSSIIVIVVGTAFSKALLQQKRAERPNAHAIVIAFPGSSKGFLTHSEKPCEFCKT